MIAQSPVGFTQAVLLSALPVEQQQEIAQHVDFSQTPVHELKALIKKIRQAVIAKSEQEPAPAPEPVPLPEGRYRAIVIDPPWPMAKIQRDLRPNQVEMPYRTMTIEEIAALPIPALATTDGCHVYLWTTHKHLHDALHLFDTWGVDYQCLMTRVKSVRFTPFSILCVLAALFSRLVLSRMGCPICSWK